VSVPSMSKSARGMKKAAGYGRLQIMPCDPALAQASEPRLADEAP